MSIPFTRWPEEFARRYREKGYWQDLPLTDILTRHAASDSIAVIDGERQLSYRELNQAADNLACSLRRQGIKLVKPRWYNWVTSLNFTLPFRAAETGRCAGAGAVQPSA